MRRRSYPSHALALGDSHIFWFWLAASEVPSAIDCIELLEASAHGDWSWRLSVAVPSTEASDGPGCPGEAVAGMGVLLALGFAFEGGAEGGKRLDLGLCEGGGGGQAMAAV